MAGRKRQAGERERLGIASPEFVIEEVAFEPAGRVPWWCLNTKTLVLGAVAAVGCGLGATDSAAAECAFVALGAFGVGAILWISSREEAGKEPRRRARPP